jgi:hypothetical protein
VVEIIEHACAAGRPPEEVVGEPRGVVDELVDEDFGAVVLAVDDVAAVQ